MDVTICIRTRNEEALLDRTLAAVFTQKHSLKVEVLVLDSESEDETRTIALRYPVRLYKLPRRLFSYSGSLNAGVSLAQGEIFIPLSGHAVPANDTWLTSLIDPIINSASTAVSYSRQLPWAGVSGPEARIIDREFPAPEDSMSAESFRSQVQAGKKPYDLARCSNASAAYRRELLTRYPFRDLPFSEDRCAAMELLHSGQSVAYAATSQVFHSHSPHLRDFRTIARRATVARAIIDAYGMMLVRGTTSASLNRPSTFMSAAKLPLYTMWLSLIVPITALKLTNPLRGREAAWRMASLGTTLGKYEGALVLARKAPHIPPPVADPSAILSSLEKVTP